MKKKIVSIALLVVFAFSLVGCAKYKEIDYKVFEDALEEVGFDDDEYYSTKNYGDYDRYVIATDGNVTYRYMLFEDEDDAYDYFEDFYDDFADAVSDRDFSGSSRRSLSRSHGFVLFNGEIDTRHWDSDIYGGVFYRGSMVIEVVASSDKKSDKSDVDEFLRALGFSHP